MVDGTPAPPYPKLKPDARIRQRFLRLRDELTTVPGIRLDACELTFYAPSQQRRAAAQAGMPVSLYAFSHGCDGFELSWDLPDEEDPSVSGRVRLLPLRAVMQDWHGVVYFDDEPADSSWRTFRPVDFFVDEACVGMFTGADVDESLYLWDFSHLDEPFRLDLDIFGYVELLCAARGFLYWQRGLRTIKGDGDSPEAQRFRTRMPQLFPQFSYAEFSELYQRLRLSHR